ncbi:MAG: hypothetical protein FJ125_02575 [Deltaproteobacteria bacterium]|nr:hypothetical protein [Deltaproteobacteria bacterium]
MSSMSRHRISRGPLVPERIRNPDRQGGFAFLPNRFLQDGFFATLSDGERSLYLFLVLASDRNGVSFYHFDRICSILQMPLETYVDTRNRLIHKDLIAYDGIRFQVLSLPARPVTTPSDPLETDEDFEDRDPATIRLCIQSSLKKR